MKKVFYHGNCQDGFGAAWAASHILGRGPDVLYTPCFYNMPTPEYSSEDEIYILDFSFPRNVLLEMNKKARKVMVIDHHKTAQEDLRGLDFCVFDMTRSGAGLTWDTLVKKERPILIDLIEDRDLWKFENDMTKRVHAYLQILPYTFTSRDILNDALSVNPQSILETAEALLKFKEREVESICGKSFEAMVKGDKVAIVNATNFWSEVGAYLLKKHPGCAYSLSFGWTGDAWLWSARSRGDFDVSAVAKRYGGGGHAAAAGFRSKTLEEIIKELGVSGEN